MLFGKPYISISKKDVINNEGDLLYEIKKSIIYGSTSHLYYVQTETKNDLTEFYSSFKKNNNSVVKPTQEQLQNKEEIKNYFEDLII